MNVIILHVRAVVVGVGYRLRLWRKPVVTLNRAAPPVRTRPDPPTVASIAVAVGRAKRIVPDMTCLPSALTMRDLMHHHGHPAAVVYGVADDGPGLRAHAWVEDERGHLVLGETAEDYERLS